MSRNLARTGELWISSYAGPARDGGGARRRVQLTMRSQPDELTPGTISLSMQGWRELVKEAARLGPDCEGDEID